MRLLLRTGSQYPASAVAPRGHRRDEEAGKQGLHVALNMGVTMTSGRLCRSKYATCTSVIVTIIGLTYMPPSAHAKNTGAWSVIKTEDPITGRKTCAVSALDRIGGMRFTQIGILYAVIEKNPDAGLLVGVSSGGKYRMPVGDIVWRVDDKPYRTLRAIDNLGAFHTASTAQEPPGSAPEGDKRPAEGVDGKTPASPSDSALQAYSKTLAATMQQQSEMVMALTATATMASGEKAKTMLDEMLAGTGLLFR